MSLDKWRSDVLAVAEKEVGNYESPSGSNKQKYGVWYGLNGVSWCAIFVSWVFNHAGHNLPKLQSDKGFSGVILGYRAAEKQKLTVGARDGQPGDIFCHNAGGGKGHTGIIVGVNKANGLVVSYDTIEGNSNSAGSRTGGMVVRHLRSPDYINLGIIRPFAADPVKVPVPVPAAPKPAPAPTEPPKAPVVLPPVAPVYPIVGGIIKASDKKYYLINEITVSLLPASSVVEVMKTQGKIWIPDPLIEDKIKIVESK